MKKSRDQAKMAGGDMLDTEVRQKFEKLRQRVVKLGLTGQDLEDLPSLLLLKAPNATKEKIIRFAGKAAIVWTISMVALLIIWVTEWPVSRFQIIKTSFNWYDQDINKQPCLVGLIDGMQDVSRPPTKCEMCKDFQEVPRVSGISQQEFEHKYAYSMVPVIIQDATKLWTAVNTFNFSFFKSIYSEDSPVLLNAESHCQFFPYKTNFESLGEVFNMSEDRANLKDGTEPWYIGWSNCDSSAANVLRKHYDRPYFLPENAESSKTDWIFMGSPGYGAHMHIDNVGNPSWQAQITGTKLWTLEPPPECYFVCERQLKVTVNPGEVIVLDTNNWYHSTLILGNEMSITIGSEYD